VEDSVLTDTDGPAGRGSAAAAPSGSRARTTGSVEALTAAVAHHVRALRSSRGWSLDELAGRSGVSKGMVVQIEAARTNPSVGTVCRLADAFGVTVARLLEAADPRPVRITPQNAAPVLWRGSAGGTGRLLGGLNEPNFVELWEWTLGPGDHHTSEDHAAGTREVIHVLGGTLVVTIDGTDHPITSGDTIDFAADRGHGYRNDGTVPARLVMVVVMPAGELDRRR
jgi:transcriptional regulator with XRE-family HTH domain